MNPPLNSVNESLNWMNPPLNSVNKSLNWMNLPLNSVNESLNWMNPPLNSVNESLNWMNPPLNSVNESLNWMNQSRKFKCLIFTIATSTHLYNKIVTMSDSYILKRIHTYRQQIIRENKETCVSPIQIIR